MAPNEKNPRKITAEAMARLRKSLEELGNLSPITFNVRTGKIIGGHQRLKCLAGMGREETEVWCVDLDAAKEAAALLTLNNSAGEWDADGLESLLKELQAEGGDLELSGFTADSLKELDIDLGGEAEPVDAEPQIDRAEELRVKWGVKLGQIWELGDHRLMCGDSTNRPSVSSLVGKDRPNAIATDPPYGVGVNYATFKDTEANTQKIIDGFFPIALSFNCPVALTPGVRVMWKYPQPAWVMAWVHPAPTGGCSWGFAGVNPILVYGKDPYLKAGRGRRPDHIVMAADREGVVGHPTPKPIKVWRWLVERISTNAGDVLYEPFSGSGTTIMACEQLGRKCRAMEISPGYVAVAIERWHQATGKTPRLLNG